MILTVLTALKLAVFYHKKVKQNQYVYHLLYVISTLGVVRNNQFCPNCTLHTLVSKTATTTNQVGRWCGQNKRNLIISASYVLNVCTVSSTGGILPMHWTFSDKVENYTSVLWYSSTIEATVNSHFINSTRECKSLKAWITKRSKCRKKNSQKIRSQKYNKINASHHQSRSTNSKLRYFQTSVVHTVLLRST